MCPNLDVVEDGHAPEQRKVLERPPDSEPGDPVRRSLEQVVALEENAPGGRAVEARQAIEQGRLARSVRPDQADDLTRLDIERDIVECDDPAEANGDVPDAQDWHATRR